MDKCPICGGQIISTCRCPRSDSTCENGHKWHFNYNSKNDITEVHEGHSDHSKPLTYQCHCKLLGYWNKETGFVSYEQQLYSEIKSQLQESLGQFVGKPKDSSDDFKSQINKFLQNYYHVNEINEHVKVTCMSSDNHTVNFKIESTGTPLGDAIMGHLAKQMK